MRGVIRRVRVAVDLGRQLPETRWYGSSQMGVTAKELCNVVFFFSSRRRHTRLQGDWSSDVCSSDLDLRRRGLAALYAANTLGAVAGCLAATFSLIEVYGTRATLWIAAAINLAIAIAEIGRGSCRERG